MTTSLVRIPLSNLAPIGLGELNEQAALQTRVDRKYVVPLAEVEVLLNEVSDDTRILEIGGARSFAYESVYFDTPDLVTYLLAARRRRRRFKIRTRTYLDSSMCWLEVKTRGARGSTVKNRLPYDRGDHAALTPGRRFVDTVLSKEQITESDDLAFVPTLITRYRRSTLFLPATLSRVTIDTDLAWEGEDGQTLRLPNMAIVETKTGSVASSVDRLLWNRGHRPARMSKYATGLAALRPELPAVPWRRTLRRFFVSARLQPTARDDGLQTASDDGDCLLAS